MYKILRIREPEYLEAISFSKYPLKGLCRGEYKEFNIPKVGTKRDLRLF